MVICLTSFLFARLFLVSDYNFTLTPIPHPPSPLPKQSMVSHTYWSVWTLPHFNWTSWQIQLCAIKIWQTTLAREYNLIFHACHTVKRYICAVWLDIQLKVSLNYWIVMTRIIPDYIKVYTVVWWPVCSVFSPSVNTFNCNSIPEDNKTASSIKHLKSLYTTTIFYEKAISVCVLGLFCFVFTSITVSCPCV